MLEEDIDRAQRRVRTDAYQMSIGEIVSMYERDEIVIAPEFQRLFRWDIGQKSKLIESMLLGIPIPSIFVFEKEDGKWELIDGLQRISTILEFMGLLNGPNDQLLPPSILEATKYLPSLHNVVWEKSDLIDGTTREDQMELDTAYQLTIRRARIGVEILKRPTDSETKYDLFQRLNAGGTQANAQELRNCIMLMVNAPYFRAIKGAAESQTFLTVTSVSDDQRERQRHIELATRFLVHTLVPYDGKLDVEEFIDEGVVALATAGETERVVRLLTTTFELLNQVGGGDVLKRRHNGVASGKVGLVGLEVIAVGVAKNLDVILSQPNPNEFINERINSFWESEETQTLTSPGLRGTVRIRRTVPLGEEKFRP